MSYRIRAAGNFVVIRPHQKPRRFRIRRIFATRITRFFTAQPLPKFTEVIDVGKAEKSPVFIQINPAPGRSKRAGGQIRARRFWGPLNARSE